jgi:hypothetical protein
VTGFRFDWLLAEHARNAPYARNGTCAICATPIRCRQRMADLADGSGVAHVACIGTAATAAVR